MWFTLVAPPLLLLLAGSAQAAEFKDGLLHPGGKLTISVTEAPAPGWARLRWRLARGLA